MFPSPELEQIQNSFTFKNHFFRVANESDVSRIRILVNSAYQDLAAMGLNYTATYQDEKITRERIAEGKALLLELDGKLIGTFLIKKENWFTGKNSAYVCQVAVLPSLKKRGLGNLLMDACEELARKEGYDSVQLDTAKPATHLVHWYQKRGYHIIGETKWEGKTYESWIFEKPIRP